VRLIDSRIPKFTTRPEVVPVVAVQRGMSAEYRKRLFHFVKHLRAGGVTEAETLEIHEVTLAWRMSAIKGLDADAALRPTHGRIPDH
jgi:cation transport regulator ChaC